MTRKRQSARKKMAVRDTQFPLDTIDAIGAEPSVDKLWRRRQTHSSCELPRLSRLRLTIMHMPIWACHWGRVQARVSQQYKSRSPAGNGWGFFVSVLLLSSAH
ncbi:hypothetical protein BN2475_410036 [Paraburkholderia ribeironis]|uniref:Uncharacterized protein n=1 Tax=Paraburkholderia ribeironis TaxID=1247936 RepID=A0A1N7S7E0_9BURK|nr:hypothetical protein BN2475_410036 [Paraburkholderia ribeironis]